MNVDKLGQLTSRTKTCHNTCTQDKVRGLRSRLKGTADHGKNCTNEDSVDTANTVGHPASCKTTEDSSEVVLQRGQTMLLLWCENLTYNANYATLMGSISHRAIW